MYTDSSDSFNEMLNEIDIKVKQLKLMANGCNKLDKHLINKSIDRKIKDIRSNISSTLRTMKND